MPKSWDAAVAVNFTGIWNGCSAVIPHMLAHKEGSHIVTTSSMGGILPGVNAGVYTATKFGSFGIMEALRVELAGTNIGTSVFSPGGVSTDNIASEAGTDSLMMDPLEAGERVLNGVVNNDLFIFTHPEFAPGMKERFDAILASEPQDGFPEARAEAETRVLTSPAYAPEIIHRTQAAQELPHGPETCGPPVPCGAGGACAGCPTCSRRVHRRWPRRDGRAPAPRCRCWHRRAPRRARCLAAPMRSASSA